MAIAIMKKPSCLLAFSTRNYDAMLRFFSDIGFEVTDGTGTQLCPLFNSGRGAYVRRGDFEFNLEESTEIGAAAAFNLFLLDISEEEIQRIAELGRYDYKCEHGFFGLSHRLTSPDGGLVTF